MARKWETGLTRYPVSSRISRAQHSPGVSPSSSPPPGIRYMSAFTSCEMSIRESRITIPLHPVRVLIKV